MEIDFYISFRRKLLLHSFKFISVLIFSHLTHFYGFGNSDYYRFDVIQNRFILKVEARGDTFNFIFDTGANQSIIDTDLATELEIPIQNKETIPTLGGKISGYSTRDTTFNIVPNMRWVIAHLSSDIDSSNFRIHGLIGASELINRHIVDINFKTKILSIDSKIDLNKFIELDLDDSRNLNNSGMAKYLPKFPTIISSISISNHLFQEVKLIIDTGCKYDIAIVANDSSLIKSIEKERQTYKTLGNRNMSVAYCEVLLLDKYLKNIKVLCPVFYEANSNTSKVFGLLGTPYFKKYNRVIINCPIGKIYFDSELKETT